MNEFASGCVPRSRITSSASARQMRQRDLAVTDTPVVWDRRAERVEPRGLRRIVRDRRAVRNDRERRGDPLEPVPEEWRHRDEAVVALTDEELLHLAPRGRAIAVVVEHELDR